MSNIIEARAKLAEIAGMAACPRWIQLSINEEILPLMTREKMVRRAPIASTPMTAAVVSQIKSLAETTMTAQEIGSTVGVSHGRVSEVLTGKRDDNGQLIRNAQ